MADYCLSKNVEGTLDGCPIITINGIDPTIPTRHALACPFAVIHRMPKK